MRLAARKSVRAPYFPVESRANRLKARDAPWLRMLQLRVSSASTILILVTSACNTTHGGSQSTGLSGDSLSEQGNPLDAAEHDASPAEAEDVSSDLSSDLPIGKGWDEEEPVSLVDRCTPHVRLLALAARAAYYPESRWSDLGYAEYTVVERGLGRAVVAWNENEIIVAIRGTAGAATWIRNADVRLVRGTARPDLSALGLGSRAFAFVYDAYAELIEAITTRVSSLSRAEPRPIYVTGHSLGGAASFLTAWALQQSFLDVRRVVTFGAPKVGNAALAAGLGQTLSQRIQRYENRGDPVPLAPPGGSIPASVIAMRHDQERRPDLSHSIETYVAQVDPCTE